MQENKQDRLTPMEALTVLFMIKLCREGDGFVTVDMLAKALNRSKSRVRLLLNSLKSKGIVIDRVPIALPSDTKEYEKKDELGWKDIKEIQRLIEKPDRGVEKKWTVVLNIEDNEAIKNFIRSRPEFNQYFGLNNVLKFLGMQDDK